MRVVLVSPDLMAASQVQSAVVAVDGEFRQVGSVADAIAVCTHPNRNVVLIDLTTLATEIGESIAALRKAANPTTVIAFAPHVHAERLEEARSAGCDCVLSRGQVHRDLADVLQRIHS